MAALSKVVTATVAMAPATNSAAVIGSLPIARRLEPRKGDKAIVPRASSATHELATAVPVVSAERRILGSIEPISASSRVPIPRLPIRARNVAVDTAAAAMPTSRAENVRVAMAQ